ncbi:MAG: hypothetical protein OWQ54_03080 [Sulfolobaceae archaeon]|nr:hypothetical protein [Sulfolobaceae archaeon]
MTSLDTDMDWRYMFLPFLLIALVVGLILASYILPYVQTPTVRIINGEIYSSTLNLQIVATTPLALGAHYTFYVVAVRIMNKSMKVSPPASFFNFGGLTTVSTVNITLSPSMMSLLDSPALIGRNVNITVYFKVQILSSLDTYVYKNITVSSTVRDV